MGAALLDELKAIERSADIPVECRRYISHHVRNGLLSLMGIAFRLEDRPEAARELERGIEHITSDLEKVGL